MLYLPNDEQVQLKKGTRRLQLKNAMRAKFEKILIPIADELIADAQIEIIRDLRAIPSVPRLADRLGVSSRTLARRFKMATGLSISEYTLQRRLDEAQSLLRRTNLSVTEIAFAVGLADPSHFTRVFKRLLGLTPTRYRAAVREKAFSPQHNPN